MGYWTYLYLERWNPTWEIKCVPYSVSLLVRKPNRVQTMTVRPLSVQLQELFGLECNYVIVCTLFSFRMLQSLCIMQKDWNYLLQTLIMHSKLKILRQVCFYCYVFSVTACVKLLDWFPTSQKNNDLWNILQV